MLQTQDVLDTLQQEHSDAPALVLVNCNADGLGNEELLRWSFRELGQQRAYCEQVLQDAGARPGDRLLLCSRDLPQFFAILHACLRLELCLIPLHPDQDQQLWQSVLEINQPRIAIFEDLVFAQQRFRSDSLPLLTFVLHGRESQWLRRQLSLSRAPLQQAAAALHSPPVDSVLIFHSSGTTGKPKAIHYSKAQLATFLYWQQHLFLPFQDENEQRDQWRDDSRDVPLESQALSPRISLLPLIHWGGLSFCLQAHMEGRCVYLANEFHPEALFALADASGCQLLMLIPAMYREMLELFQAGMYPRALRYCLTMGEAMPAGLTRDLYALTGLRLYTAYGMTEALSGLAHGTESWDQIPEGSCGRQHFGEIKLVDAQGKAAPTHGKAEGELWVRNATTSPCYLNSELLDQKYVDGWYRTGDSFFRDCQGYYFFRGRLDAMCVHNGRNVYPQQIEAVFIQHKEVAACVAAPITTTDGARRLAILVLSDPLASLSVARLLDFYLEHGALYAAPVFLQLTDSIPATASGKPERIAVAAILQNAYDKANQGRVLIR